MEIQKGAKIGLISRIDYGSKGFRQSVINAGCEYFKKEGVHFISLAGGLIDERSISRDMKTYVKEHVETEKDKIKEQNLKIKAKNKKAKKPSALISTLIGEQLVTRKSVLEEEFLREKLAKESPTFYPKSVLMSEFGMLVVIGFLLNMSTNFFGSWPQ